ncbi:hypothetical protein B0T19DRAFT_465165 [Cercophora scortea]|uniref:Uncharacterized protein n=1 Tax=Cercophora scortea TaxID=314031 RepID=A0AAE0M655_9PEZI|nr:hypothetical protein B0T19DRAFT_465165 [Cercophora scortea]
MDGQQQIHQIENQLLDIIICADSTAHTASELQELYRFYKILSDEDASESAVSASKASTFLERQSALYPANIQIKARRESAATFELAEKGHRDSASLKILSIITLIYLPSTIVSFVRQNTVGEKVTISSVGYSQNWWLFFAISLPLILLTVGVWYSWSNYLYDLDVASVLAGWGQILKGHCDHLHWQRRPKTRQSPHEVELTP